MSFCFHYSAHVLHQMHKSQCIVKDNSIFKLLDFIVFWTENINRSSFAYCLFAICFVLSVSNVKRLHTHIFFGKCGIINTIFYQFKIPRCIFHDDLWKQITFIIYVSPFCCWQQNADVIDVCNTELIDTFMWPVSRFTLRFVN